jgi:mono/diheme cytochrome c family protein
MGILVLAIPTRTVTMACLVIVAAASGCGSPRLATSNQARILARGRAIFNRSCSPCHSLVGHEQGTSGGDLVYPQLTVVVIESFTRVMPMRSALSKSDVAAVAQWVHTVARSHRTE